MRYSLPLCLLQRGLFLQEEQCQRFPYSNQTNPLSLPDPLLQQKILVLRTPPLPQRHTSVSREGTQRYTGLKAPELADRSRMGSWPGTSPSPPIAVKYGEDDGVGCTPQRWHLLEPRS